MYDEILVVHSHKSNTTENNKTTGKVSIETIVVIAFSDKPRVIFRPTFSQKNSTVIEARRNFFIVDKCIWAKIEQIMVLHSLELDLRIDFETDNFDFDLDFLPKHTLNE